MFPRGDRQILRQEAERLGARRVLEFGPGHSTGAFLDAGCRVVTLEHDAYWFEKARHRFRDEARVEIGAYANRPLVSVPNGALGGKGFDLAFVDSPVGVTRPGYVAHPGQRRLSRYNTMQFALRVAPVVLLHDAQRSGERNTLKKLARRGYRVERVGKRIARILQPVGANAAL